LWNFAGGAISKMASGKKTDFIKSQFEACMLGGAIGDTIGFLDGKWEFNKNTKSILESAQKLGGVLALDLRKYKVSDDTVMHLATSEALNRMVNNGDYDYASLTLFDQTNFLNTICDRYVECLKDMEDREPGAATLKARQSMENHQIMSYSNTAGGNGAAMRTMCIGLLFPHRWQKSILINHSIIASVVTHNNPTAVLGGIVSALFTSYGVKKIPIELWPFLLLDEDMPLINECLKNLNISQVWAKHKDSTEYFISMWEKYVAMRFSSTVTYRASSSSSSSSSSKTGKSAKSDIAHNPELKKLLRPSFPKVWFDNSDVRDETWRMFRFSDWSGSSGHDSVMIAYDSLLYTSTSSAKPSFNLWKTLMILSALHEGDSDSTASIAGAWFGSITGISQLPRRQLPGVEYHQRLLDEAGQLYNHCLQLSPSE
jgi:ADP-ribosylarginine hydrolase